MLGSFAIDDGIYSWFKEIKRMLILGVLMESILDIALIFLGVYSEEIGLYFVLNRKEGSYG